MKAGQAAVLALLLFVLQTGCGSPSPLDPKSPEASDLARLSWILFGLGALVFVGVMALFGYALLRGSRAATRQPDVQAGTRMIVLGGIVFPSIVLIGLMGLSVKTSLDLSEADGAEPLEVEVIGWQFWWEIRYPQLDITTANEIHIPTDRPVRLSMTSVDVIHSFWVPQLARKLDLNPGQTTTLHLRASEAGSYRGVCAEFCGIQHTRMAFYVIAESNADFGAWVRAMQQPASPPATELARRGLSIFFAENCSACHGIRGTGAAGGAAPDLTHLMSRTYIAAGTLVTNRENVQDFVENAQEIKRGSSMPSIADLDEETLEALITYLVSLE